MWHERRDQLRNDSISASYSDVADERGGDTDANALALTEPENYHNLL